MKKSIVSVISAVILTVVLAAAGRENVINTSAENLQRDNVKAYGASASSSEAIKKK